MPKWNYLVIARDGSQRDMLVEAKDDSAARRQLRRQGMTVVKSLAANSAPKGIVRLKLASGFDVVAFTNRLAPLLQAEIPLEKALTVIEDGARNSEERSVIRQLRTGLHEGRQLSRSTREMPQYFSPLFSSLIEAGEESGCLAEVVQELRRFLKESKDFRDFVLTSSIYPVIVVSVTMLVIVLLFTVFVPRFAKIFEELGKEIPFLTRIMLETGNFMQAIWWLWPLLIAGLVYFYRKSRDNGKLKSWKDKIVLKIPLYRNFVISVQVGRFIRTLAIMAKNHVQLLPAIRISRRVITNGIIAESFARVEDHLRGGVRLSQILGESSFMPSGSIAMLKVAEESGDLGEMLDRIALETEENTRILVKRLLAFLEPAIILVLALIVLLVVLSIFLAIMEMNVIK